MLNRKRTDKHCSHTELTGKSSFAYVTSVKNPLTHWNYAQYDYYAGKPVDEEDANAAIVTSSYDALGRVRQQIFPDGALST